MILHECEYGSRCRILRVPEVLALVGVGRSTLLGWVARDIFPAQMQIGPRVVGWWLCVVMRWLSSRG